MTSVNVYQDETNLAFLDGHVEYRTGNGCQHPDVAWAYDFATGKPKGGSWINSEGYLATFNLY